MTYQQVKFKMEQWCAYQERCTFEVLEKLKSIELTEDQKEEIIEDLKKSNFINEIRFAKHYCSGKFRIKNWGKIKIAFHLKQKRIPSEIIKIALQEIDPKEYEDTIIKLIQKKKLELKKNLSEYEIKSKIINYLISKGYEMDIIYSCFPN